MVYMHPVIAVVFHTAKIGSLGANSNDGRDDRRAIHVFAAVVVDDAHQLQALVLVGDDGGHEKEPDVAHFHAVPKELQVDVLVCDVLLFDEVFVRVRDFFEQLLQLLALPHAERYARRPCVSAWFSHIILQDRAEVWTARV